MSTSSTIASLSLTLALVAGGIAGCASDEGARRSSGHEPAGIRSAEDPSERPPKAPGRRADDPSGMHLETELGVLETSDVEETLQGRLDDVRACYRRAGKAQDYAGGRVLLRFLVAGDGHVDDVWVVESSLGNYSVERCVVDIGRHVVFGAPSGNRATTFEYPIEFRSTNEMAVLDIDGLKVERDLAAFLPQLAACGQVAEQSVAAIMYIEPNGFPGSVGLAAGATLDEPAADCVVQTIRGWKMSAVLPGHVLRVSFEIPTVIAQADAASSLARQRPAVSSASARRRHK
ncbi:MAG: TonB family protein [Myxococcales bacterium]|nr:TonB family protein [Myxococcales bacterium]